MHYYFSFLQSITTQDDLKQTIKQTNFFIYCIATYKLAGFAHITLDSFKL